MEQVPGPGLDEKLWRLGKAARLGKFDAWSFDFVRSIQRQAKRADWKPSVRQDAIINRLLSEASAPAGTDSEPGSLLDIEDTLAMREG